MGVSHATPQGMPASPTEQKVQPERARGHVPSHESLARVRVNRNTRTKIEMSIKYIIHPLNFRSSVPYHNSHPALVSTRLGLHRCAARCSPTWLRLLHLGRKGVNPGGLSNGHVSPYEHGQAVQTSIFPSSDCSAACCGLLS